MSKSIDIHVIADGPYKVSNAEHITFCGERLPVDGDVYLCRCGKSSNAPFCDGSHNAGFDGSRAKEPNLEVRVWEGKTLKTFFNPNTCMHAFHCKPLKALRERELAGDATAADEIMKAIGTCPSGALTYETTGATEPAATVFEADIAIMEGGEIRVQRPFALNAEPMERMMPERLTLCRCGLSKNKPYCDGQHKKAESFR
jgi:CDGSH-type Zn-finger protein